MTHSTRILVLGGGYAGVMAALRLAGKGRRYRLPVDVTLVNGQDHFVERPRLHELAVGGQIRNKPLRDMLRGSGATFVQGWATAINPASQHVTVQTTQGEQRLPYDRLVYAIGSHVNRSAVPGVDQHAYALDPFGKRSTTDLAHALQQIDGRAARIVVVGGGATGLEAAAEFKATHPAAKVALVTQGDAGAFKGPRIQNHVAAALAEQQITLHEHTPVTAVAVDRLITQEGSIPADIIVWAGGFVAPALASNSGIRTNGRNQVIVDPFLRSLSHPYVYAAGDAAVTLEEPGVPLRMALLPALVSGAQAADNILAELRGQALRPFSFVWYGQGIALGPRDAVGFATYPVDRPRGLVFRRRTAVVIRGFFVWLLSAMLEVERRLPGAFYWNGKGRYARQQRRTRTTAVTMHS